METKEYNWFPKMFLDMINHARDLGTGLKLAEDPEAKLFGWASDEVRFTMHIKHLNHSSRYFSQVIETSIEEVCGEPVWDLIRKGEGRIALGANMHRFEMDPTWESLRERRKQLSV